MRNRCVVAGIDWARYSDYTAVVALAVGESGCRVLGIDRFNRMGWDSQISRVVGVPAGAQGQRRACGFDLDRRSAARAASREAVGIKGWTSRSRAMASRTPPSAS